MKNSNAEETKGYYEDNLDNWISDEKAGFEFINVLGKLFYDKSIELIFFRSQLFDRSSSVILFKHSYSEQTVGKKLTVRDSLLLAHTLYNLDIPPAKIDIGKLNLEWTEEKQNYAGPKEFVLDKLKEFAFEKPSKKKPRDVVLFGFGRIGRLIAREMVIQGNGSQLRVRAIVTRSNSPEDFEKRASLFRHDSIHGPFRGVAIANLDDETLYLNGHKVKLLSASHPSDLDYTKYGIHDALLIDNTGVWRDRDGLGQHLKAKGIGKVILTAPGKGDIKNIVYGVNHLSLDLKNETIFSAASCTTNAIVPTLSVIHDNYTISKGHIETIHSYTNDQNLLDNYHKKPRRGRAAAVNMVITSTGAGTAAAKALPDLKGKLTANAVRIPTPNVSLVILQLEIEKKTTVDKVNEVMRNAALYGGLVSQIRYSSSPESVSSDFIGDPVTAIFDSPSTIVSEDGHSIVLYLWYDNEFGYSIQVIRLAKFIGEVTRFLYY